MKVEFLGKLPNYVSAKDAILKLIATIGISGAQGYLIEYTGACLKKFNMEDRMTICNMSIECGARAGIIAPDEVVFKYLYGLNYTPKNKEWRDAVAYWKNLKSDPDATYDSTVVIDVNEMEPMVTWGINPGMCIGISQKIPSLDQAQSDEKATYQKAYQYTGLQQDQPICGVPIDYVFFGSCTNARIPDFEIAARLLRDKTIHPDVRMIMVPASEYIKKEVEKRGWADIFIRAGVDWRNPGCSACLGMNDDKIPAGKRCISTSNRNFMGRQGPGSITHLGSPATVIASAIAGYITSPFYEKN